jgi:hypothetical protein
MRANAAQLTREMEDVMSELVIPGTVSAGTSPSRFVPRDDLSDLENIARARELREVSRRAFIAEARRIFAERGNDWPTALRALRNQRLAEFRMRELGEPFEVEPGHPDYNNRVEPVPAVQGNVLGENVENRGQEDNDENDENRGQGNNGDNAQENNGQEDNAQENSAQENSGRDNVGSIQYTCTICQRENLVYLPPKWAYDD